MTHRGRMLILSTAAAGVLLTGALWARSPGAGERQAPAPARGHTLKVRVWEPGAVAPTVSVNVPVVLVTVAMRAVSILGILDHHLKTTTAVDNDGPPIHLRAADLVAVWSGIVRAGPSQLVSVDDGAGGRVEIRID